MKITDPCFTNIVFHLIMRPYQLFSKFRETISQRRRILMWTPFSSPRNFDCLHFLKFSTFWSRPTLMQHCYWKIINFEFLMLTKISATYHTCITGGTKISNPLKSPYYKLEFATSNYTYMGTKNWSTRKSKTRKSHQNKQMKALEETKWISKNILNSEKLMSVLVCVNAMPTSWVLDIAKKIAITFICYQLAQTYSC